MQTSEVRIGNLIQTFYDKEIIVTGQIIFEGINEDFKPIPLTEERLLKFGFKDNGSTFSKPDNCIVTHDLKTVGVYIKRHEDDIQFDCPKHVHQLQNLYFALIGEELIINEDVNRMITVFFDEHNMFNSSMVLK